MKKVCAAGTTLLGIDVSHYEQRVEWDTAMNNGVMFAYCKATDGVSFTDRTYKSHHRVARDVGMLAGAYHFFHPGQDPVLQAKHFCSVIGDTAGDLPPVMDWESTDDIPSSEDRRNAILFLEGVATLTKRQPIIYGSPYFLDALTGTRPEFRRYPLWIAHYGVKCPLVPQPWTNWTFWQDSESHQLPGTGVVDSNRFNGTWEQLRALAGVL